MSALLQAPDQLYWMFDRSIAVSIMQVYYDERLATKFYRLYVMDIGIVMILTESDFNRVSEELVS